MIQYRIRRAYLIKLIPLIILFILCFCSTYSQYNLPKADSLKIEALKKKLTSLNGTARIDCLNDLGKVFSYHLSNPILSHQAYYYTKQAHDESLKINYKYGLAFSSIDLGFLTRDSIKARKYMQDAISIGESLQNYKILGWAYLRSRNHYYLDKPIAIALWKKALYYFEKAGDFEGQGEAAFRLCQEYSWKGNYEEAYLYCETALSISNKKRIHITDWREDIVQGILLAVVGLDKDVVGYKNAIVQLTELKKYGIDKMIITKLLDARGRAFEENMKAENAMNYNDPRPNYQPTIIIAKLFLGENYLASRQFERAIKLFKECNDSLELQDLYPRLMLDLGHAYEGQRKYDAALPYAKKGLALTNEPKQRLDGYELISRLYRGMGKKDSAYFYQQKYAYLKDAITDPQFLVLATESQQKAIKLSLLQKDNQLKDQLLREQTLIKEQKDAVVQLLDKDNKLTQQQLKQELLLKNDAAAKIALLDKDNKIKQQQLKQESLIKNFLFVGLFILLLTGFFIFRNLILRRKNEKLGRERIEHELKLQQLESDKKHTEMQQQATELEMQALRAQMNPHFIFNCLSSINKYIIKNETESASDYLTRFSRLIRMVLINSQKPLITLEDELDMLRLYLDMERLRFNNVFDYNITLTNTIEPAAVFIPPLLLQPFCENAIWHGLMHKEGHGKLDIALTIHDDVLLCRIIDNGIGREKAAELKSKSTERQKSLGLKITNNRLALLNQSSREDSYYEMNDIIDKNGNTGGTQVDIRIRYKNLVE